MIEVKKKINTFKNRKVLVVGLARSGAGAANLLAELGAHVSVTDRKSAESLKERIEKLKPGIDVVAGETPDELFETSDLIVISPGVPSSADQFQRARERGIPIIGELELAYQTVANFRSGDTGDELKSGTTTPDREFATPHFIGVTGTNGKSTVTTLINLVLREDGFKTVLGGNIGNALTEEIQNAMSFPETASKSELTADRCSLHADFVVAEISSFQLESISEFKPRVAAILNLTPDHLDRYDDMDDYVSAKARIFENQTPDDYLVLNADDARVMEMAGEEMSRNRLFPGTLYFSSRQEVEGVYCKNGMLYCNIPSHGEGASNLPFISADEIKIKGAHNLENAMAASLVCLISGCSRQAVRSVLMSFPGLEHRLEIAGVIDGVTYINDSKGTNVGAVAKSLESLENVILIMGGLDKDGDFSVLRELVESKVRLLILLGSAKEKIAEALGGRVATVMTESLHEAVTLARESASPGDTVLLSPGCASFDMFADFEDRGRKFKEAVQELAERNT